jgi:hypothetical protein
VHFAPTVTCSQVVTLTPMKHDSPISKPPEPAMCDARERWFPITEWFPLHSVTLSPMHANGWVELSSRMKQFLACVRSEKVVALELT